MKAGTLAPVGVPRCQRVSKLGVLSNDPYHVLTALALRTLLWRSLSNVASSGDRPLVLYSQRAVWNLVPLNLDTPGILGSLGLVRGPAVTTRNSVRSFIAFFSP